MANKNLGCFITDAEGKLVIGNGDLLEFLSKEPGGKHTHVLVGYYPHGGFSGEEEYISKVFPIESIYFWKRDEWAK